MGYRDETKVVQIGKRQIGGGNPILIQSMCNTKTEDVEATVDQILKLEAAGCDIIRVAVPDLAAAKANGITVMRVPGYSPEAVAQHAMALAQAANRRICKAYIKVRNNNFALDGLLGQNFYGACAGIVGTGRIGAAMARICHGFGMNVLCYDMYKNPEVEKFARYVSLEELLDRKPRELSGGQQQRVAIARALVSKPAIVLADEPTGNLDSKTSSDVLGLLKVTSQKFHQTLVMITHNNEIAQLADRIIRIEDGRIMQ